LLQRPWTGFTLVEIIIGMAILAGSVLGLMSLLSSASLHSTLNRDHQLALDAAHQKMEAVKADAKTNLSQVVARYNQDPADDPEGVGSAPGASFTVAGLDALYTDVDGLPGAVILEVLPDGRIDVTVTVTWRGVRDNASNFSLRSQVGP
jgi:type II secretory pathway pseudopilin PulG